MSLLSLHTQTIVLLPLADAQAAGVDGISLSVRALHLLAGMILVGGLAYLRFVWAPAAKAIGNETASAAFDQGRRRWSLAVSASSLLLIVSGLISFATKHSAFKAAGMEMGSSYHLAFGLKFLSALVLMFLAALLAGRTSTATKIRQKMTLWLNVCLILAVIIVVLAGIMRQLPGVPDPAASPAEAAFILPAYESPIHHNSLV